MLRIVFLILGLAIVLVGMILGPLPGPLGLPIIAVGLVIILRNSPWARRLYVRYNRRWPKWFHLPNKVIRPRRKRPVEAPDNAT